MKVSYVALGQNVRRAREAAGLTPEELSARMQISPEIMRHIEQGERPMSLELLARIMDTLDIQLAQLMENAFA